MKYILVLALAMAACAHAVPEYLGAYANYRAGYVELQRRLTFVKPNKEQVEYVALTAAVGGVAAAENLSKLSYDTAYNLALVFAELGRVDPETVQQFGLKQLTLLRGKLAKLTEVIKASPSEAKIDAAVKHDKELQREARLLFAASDLGRQYKEKEPELLAAVKKNNVNEYLLSGKDRLKLLINFTAKVGKLLLDL